jgi:hypothetical protein
MELEMAFLDKTVKLKFVNRVTREMMTMVPHHVKGMDKTMIPRRAIKLTFEGKRPMGRPRSRCQLGT